MWITAQISAYPLGQESFIPPIDAAIAALQESGVETTVGPLSTLISGEEEAVFAALRRAFAAAAAYGATVMVATLTNACARGVNEPAGAKDTGGQPPTHQGMPFSSCPSGGFGDPSAGQSFVSDWAPAGTKSDPTAGTQDAEDVGAKDPRPL